MMACVSPSSLHLDESLQTLQYAHRARGIQNSPSVQIVRGGDDELVHGDGLLQTSGKDRELVRMMLGGRFG